MNANDRKRMETGTSGSPEGGWFEGMDVDVNVDGGGRVGLAVKETSRSTGEDRVGAYRETVRLYGNAEETVRVELKLRDYGRFTLGWVKGTIANANAFGSQRTFAPEQGIVLRTGPIPDIRGLMAIVQHKDWWTRPHFDRNPANLPARTQSLLLRHEAGYTHALPVSGPLVRTDLSGAPDGVQFGLSLHQGGRAECEALAFVIGSGTDPFALAQRHVDAALLATDYPTLPRERKRYPAILDYLGWCSWDAFYHQVNEAGVLAKAAEFASLGLPVRWVMIDDGWLTVADGKLSAFEADRAKFPDGLASAIGKLKSAFGVRWVGVWHTIAGYWGGIDPGSAIAREHAAYLEANPRGALLPAPDAGRGFGFWHAWHSYLARQGIDFLKVDSQSAITNFWKGAKAIGESAAAAHQALEASAALHFDDTIINCMGMAAENMWNRPKSAVSRSSDDFVPKERFGFAEHALQNAYNSYLHGMFYWGDWDMFWTKNHDDTPNAVLRAVSGGPVYFSDAPGGTDPAKLWPLVYRDGRIIRCDRPANPTADCLCADPTADKLPLKLWNTSGSGKAGIVAAFHIGKHGETIDGTVGAGDVPDLEGETFAVYEHFSRTGVIVGAAERLPLRLEAEGCAMVTLVPADGLVTPVGLADKYVPADAVTASRTEGDRCVTELKEGGRFVFAARRRPASVAAGGRPLTVNELGGMFYEVDTGRTTGAVTVEIRLE